MANDDTTFFEPIFEKECWFCIFPLASGSDYILDQSLLLFVKVMPPFFFFFYMYWLFLGLCQLNKCVGPQLKWDLATICLIYLCLILNVHRLQYKYIAHFSYS